jgi:hypothetical protein
VFDTTSSPCGVGCNPGENDDFIGVLIGEERRGRQVLIRQMLRGCSNSASSIRRGGVLHASAAQGGMFGNLTQFR